jgi:hypothetical protein
MQLKRFQRLLDIHGPRPEAWPLAERAAAERLAARDPGAASALAEARRLAACLDRCRPTVPAGAAERVLRGLVSLPPQRSGFVWLAWLRKDEFAPAWPSLAAFATVAAIGFLVGITSLDRPSSPAEVDVSSLMLETGVTGLGQ